MVEQLSAEEIVNGFFALVDRIVDHKDSPNDAPLRGEVEQIVSLPTLRRTNVLNGETAKVDFASLVTGDTVHLSDGNGRRAHVIFVGDSQYSLTASDRSTGSLVTARLGSRHPSVRNSIDIQHQPLRRRQ